MCPNGWKFPTPEMKDHSLDDLYVENFSHTEYQSEATVYAYLKQVSDFLKRYQSMRCCPQSPMTRKTICSSGVFTCAS